MQQGATVLAHHSIHGANRAGRDQSPNLGTEREESSPYSLQKENPLRPGSSYECSGLRGRDCQGFLAQDRFACLDGHHGILEVMTDWCSDVDYIYIRIDNQLSVRSVQFHLVRRFDFGAEVGCFLQRA